MFTTTKTPVYVRSFARSIAKAHMRIAGVEKPNRKMRGGAWRYWFRWVPSQKRKRARRAA